MTPAPESPLRLASYNIRAGLGTDLKRDATRVLKAIAALRADIVTLQEADHRLGARHSALPRDLIARYTGLDALPIGENGKSLGWHGIAMLARPGIAIEDIHRFDLPGLEPRGAVIADLRTGGLGPIRVVGVHLGLLHSSRRAQLRHIRRELQHLAPLPTVIMGDFNEWSKRRELGRYLGPGYTIQTPGRTFPARMPALPLDRIAHCDALAVHPLPPVSTRHPHPSDHLPVMAEVTKPAPDTPGALPA